MVSYIKEFVDHKMLKKRAGLGGTECHYCTLPREVMERLAPARERELVASSAARADEEGLAEAAEAEEAAAVAEDALPKARRGTGKGTPQSCRRCGQPRRGHLCTNPKQTAEEGGAEEQAWQGAAGRKRGRDGVAPAATRRSWVGLGAGEAGASLPGSSGGSGGADGADGAEQSEEEEEVVVVEEGEEGEEVVVVKEEAASVHVGGSGPTPSPPPGPQPGASASAAEEASPGSASTAEVEAEEMQAEEAEAEEEAAGEVGAMGSAAAVTATVAVAAAAVPALAPTITDAVAVAAPVAVTAAVPSLTTMMTQLRQQLDLESSAQLPQVESAAAGLGFTPDPSRNLGQRIRALWQALVL